MSRRVRLAAFAAATIAGVAAAEPLRMGIKLLPTALDPHFRSSGENNNGLEHLCDRLIC
jgi:hypothetical protein